MKTIGRACDCSLTLDIQFFIEEVVGYLNQMFHCRRSMYWMSYSTGKACQNGRLQ